MAKLIESLDGVPVGVVGSVYIIHFDRAFHHARHYVGWAQDNNVEERMLKHMNGQGSSLLRAVNGENIPWLIARVWHNADRNFERWLKNQKRTAMFCPHCTDKPRRASLTWQKGFQKS